MRIDTRIIPGAEIRWNTKSENLHAESGSQDRGNRYAFYIANYDQEIIGKIRQGIIELLTPSDEEKEITQGKVKSKLEYRVFMISSQAPLITNEDLLRVHKSPKRVYRDKMMLWSTEGTAEVELDNYITAYNELKKRAPKK